MYRKNIIRLFGLVTIAGFCGMALLGYSERYAAKGYDAASQSYTLTLNSANGALSGSYSTTKKTNTAARTTSGTEVDVYYVNCMAKTGYYAQMKASGGYFTNSTALATLSSIVVTGASSSTGMPVLSWGATAACSTGSTTLSSVGKSGTVASQTVAVSGSYFKLAAGSSAFYAKTIAVTYVVTTAGSSASSSSSSSPSSTPSSVSSSSSSSSTSATYLATSSYRIRPVTSSGSSVSVYNVKVTTAGVVSSSIVKTLSKNTTYTSYEDVALYYQAFKALPQNYVYGTSSSVKSSAYATWGKNARLYTQTYTRTDGYTTYLPTLYSYSYFEADIGGTSAYAASSSWDRGTYRLVIVPSGVKCYGVQNDSALFYTTDHYAHFQECLNFSGGWGTKFDGQSGSGSGTWASHGQPATVSLA